jgi:hypothetical protein
MQNTPNIAQIEKSPLDANVYDFFQLQNGI